MVKRYTMYSRLSSLSSLPPCLPPFTLSTVLPLNYLFPRSCTRAWTTGVNTASWRLSSESHSPYYICLLLLFHLAPNHPSLLPLQPLFTPPLQPLFTPPPPSNPSSPPPPLHPSSKSSKPPFHPHLLPTISLFPTLPSFPPTPSPLPLPSPFSPPFSPSLPNEPPSC